MNNEPIRGRLKVDFVLLPVPSGILPLHVNKCSPTRKSFITREGITIYVLVWTCLQRHVLVRVCQIVELLDFLGYYTSGDRTWSIHKQREDLKLNAFLIHTVPGDRSYHYPVETPVHIKKIFSPLLNGSPKKIVLRVFLRLDIWTLYIHIAIEWNRKNIVNCLIDTYVSKKRNSLQNWQ